MSFRAYAGFTAYAVLALSGLALSGSTPPVTRTLPPRTIATAATVDSAPIPAPPERKPALTGIASWYGTHWQGRKTASGTRFDIHKLTAAHPDLPLNTRVRVTNLLNGRSVVVVVNDRGPYVGERVLDLSEAAAKRLGMIKDGLAPVYIELLAAKAA
jgi:peptidoglycan lytic transglycosylase